MSTAVKTRKDVENKTILNKDANASLRILVQLTRKLVNFADQETQSLVTNDHMRFAFLQRDKEQVADNYAKASEEFRARLDEFRKADKGTLMQLDALQAELHDKTSSNNVMIARIKERAHANTQSTLFSAQELGQRVQFQDQKPSSNEVKK